MEHPERIEKIVDYIIAQHRRKTHDKHFTAILACSSVEGSMTYYDLFKKKKSDGVHDLRVATIFSLSANEEDLDEDNGRIPDEENFDDGQVDLTRRDKLNEYIRDYNEMFDSNYNADNQEMLYNYFKDIQIKVKARKIDILIVVNMFLTGFDSKALNTLYVDKNLKYHGLIQAFSRTNRILDQKKSQGNIICFRDLKARTDEAITLFSNKEAVEEVLLEPYETYVEQFNEAYQKLQEIAPDVDSVNELPDEEAEVAFVKQFRQLVRIKNVLSGFADFDHNDLSCEEQTFEDYKSKYLDLYDKVRTSKETEPTIIGDIDFEVELLHKDEINVSYIFRLLGNITDEKKSEKEKQEAYRRIMDMVSSDPVLRKKK
jgi:type I restriction enzyme R subunit